MIENKLTKNQIKYVLFHLRQHALFDDKIISYNKLNYPTAIFTLTTSEIQKNLTVDYKEREIPIIFSDSNSKEIFSFDESKNLIFHHDLLKSAFYILSGAQEYNSEERDTHSRYCYENSLQKKLDFISYPIVNYYFEMILDGIEEFCKIHNLEFKRKRLFDNFGFFLSHDVDRISFYGPKETLSKILQILKLRPSTYSFKLNIKHTLKSLHHLLFPNKEPDPWWNFEYLIDLEKELGIRSTFFFLHSRNKKLDSKYRFDDDKIALLINRLEQDGFEVGLHGSYESYINADFLKDEYNRLYSVLGKNPVGIRQHFLRYQTPDSAVIQENVGLKYDNTLTFAEHEGYRNGYCYPFHPYDFKNDRMLSIWMIPLTIMEVTILQYRKLSFDNFRKIIDHQISEAKKFGGLISLLWHNCRLLYDEFNVVSNFYPSLLKDIVKMNPEILTGKDFITKIEEEIKK